MKFEATILLNGKTATGFEVPESVVESLGAGKAPPVKVSINGHTYRSTIARRGERYLIGVSAINREAAGLAAGDVVEIGLELDTAPREVSVPPDLAALLAKDEAAKNFFESLTPSQKRWYVEPIETAKKPETRERRLEKALRMLRERRKR